MTTRNQTEKALRDWYQHTASRPLFLWLIVTGLGLSSLAQIDQSADAAKPKIMSMEQAWELKKSIIWDLDRREIHALIQSRIVVDNVTDGVITGRITDGYGNAIGIYGRESVVMARFGYANGMVGKWLIVTKPDNGHFAFEIPSKYADADRVEVWINSNSFSIKPDKNPGENNTSWYRDFGTEVQVSDDGIFVIRGAPPLSFIDLSSDEGLDIQEFPVYQSEIDARVTSSRGLYNLD